MDYDYDSLVVLSAVVRTGSFEAAANSLNVTQSAVSQRIKQLEEKVGSILVQRGRPCVATDDGLLLCQHVEQVSLLQHELADQLAARGTSSGSSAVSVRIAVNSDSLATWFPDVMKRALNELNLLLEIIPDDQEFTEERLRSGDALAIVTSNNKPIPGCLTVPLGAMDYLAIASPEFAEAHFAEGCTQVSLAKAPSIQFDRKDTLPQQWMMLAFGTTGKLVSHYIPSYEGHLLAAQRGVGWAMMPLVTVKPMIERGELVELVNNVRVRTPLHWQSRSQSSATLSRLSQIVADVAGEMLAPPILEDAG
ncbi:MAG: LysR family transcriptional regulator ArgP [Silicimonas sp.]|nr:LysR family transcriptional regulator ArgP [Silicimonas sp.]